MQNKYVPEILPLQRDVFYTAFGSDTRMELKNCYFGKGKLAILLQKLDTKTNKQIDVITCFIDLPKALVMAQDILSGRYAAMTKDATQIVAVFKDLGGQPAERANRPDRKPLYREFSIQKGKKWMFRGASGPGKVTETGGFAPDGRIEKQIVVGMDNETIKEVAMMIQAEYQAYRTAEMLVSALEPQY